MMILIDGGMVLTGRRFSEHFHSQGYPWHRMKSTNGVQSLATRITLVVR